MCWSFEVSLFTFIVGSIFNYMVFRLPQSKTNIKVLCVLWEYILCVQLSEALAWKTQSSKSASTNIFSGKLTMFLITTQPIVLGGLLLMFCGGDVPSFNRMLSIMIMGVYILWLVYNITHNFTAKSLTPSRECSHLDLYWWKTFTGNAIPYLITLFLIMILLIRPLNLMWFQLSFISITLVISYLFYGCSIGSMWCFLSAFAPVLLYFYVQKYPV